MYYGFYFLEFADYYGREGVDGSSMVNLLFVALKSLGNPKISNELVRYVYELKLMVLNGEYPQVFACGGCGTKEDLRYFSVEESSVFCGGCGAARRRKIPLSPLPSLYDPVCYRRSAGEALYLYRHR